MTLIDYTVAVLLFGAFLIALRLRRPKVHEVPSWRLVQVLRERATKREETTR